MTRARLAIAVLALVAAVAQAQDKPCAKADAANAEKAIDRVVNWPQLAKAFQDFRHCDKAGPVADLYTETLIRLMVDWKDVDGMAKAFGDPAFKAFAFEHLRSPAAKEDLDSVYSRAKKSCPAKHEALCAELAEMVKSTFAAPPAPAPAPAATPAPAPAPAK